MRKEMKSSHSPSPTRVGRRLTSWGLGLALAAAATVGVSSWAQEPQQGMGMGPGMHGHHHGGMWAASPEQVARRVNHLLRGLEATEAQRSQITQIAQAAAKDMAALRESGRSLRAEGLRLWTAPTVDAAAVEALRQQQLAVHDKVSRRMSQALIDAAQVLTPAQRVKVAERLKARAEMRRNHAGHRGAPGASAPL